MSKLFGTDGIRGIANEYPMNCEFLMKLGQVTGTLLGENHRKAIIGRDTRISGSMLKSAFVSGMCSTGFNVYDAGIIPTPAICYLTKKLNFDLGVVISASHNIFSDNGIKFFNSNGFKLSDEIENEIESAIRNKKFKHLIGKKNTIGNVFGKDYKKEYIAFIQKKIHRSNGSLKIVVDCANGAIVDCAKVLFEDILKIKTIFINNTPDGLNINNNCGSLHPSNMVRIVLKHKADIGFSFDGDADRMIMCDEKGNIVDGDDIIGICADSFKVKSVVGTVMSNFGLEKFLNSTGIKFKRTKVGDKFVLEEMLKTNALIGGEPSGHIIFLDDSTTGDGLITAVNILNIIKEENKPLSKLVKFKHYPQSIFNIEVKKKKDIKEMPKVKEAITNVENRLNSNGRIVFRFSGTEPVARIMLEGEDKSILNKLSQEVISAVKKECC